jgi:hypothetical protein
MPRLLCLVLVSGVLTFAGAPAAQVSPAPARDIGDVSDPGPVPGALWRSESWLQLQEERARRSIEWRNAEELQRAKRAFELQLQMRRQSNDAY